MNRYKTLCQWYLQFYTSAGAYSNHLENVYSKKNVKDLKELQSRKRQLSNISDTAEVEYKIAEVNFTDIISANIDYYSDLYHSKDSNKEARFFSVEPESNEVFPEED
ncbi:hypothetical protein L211DRAFT_851499 [Terfezia boudieri ATCC MYA-4762]|uniref:Uncharacterized protein n=1 Tax=Terfezia boudieri ATCC MYA-4762 TaxID=1051890 RepID=A0A3N4LF72_9PEZI|nr:hypothetical protein L211DRAFT_851499 [Terfezia boudieri ATCC MYA-4762]